MRIIGTVLKTSPLVAFSDSLKADTAIETAPIRTVVIGDAYVERRKTTKPQTLVCVIGRSPPIGAKYTGDPCTGAQSRGLQHYHQPLL
jgi:hypothetical protein